MANEPGSNHNESRKRYVNDAIAAWEHYRTTGLHVTREDIDEWMVKIEVGEDAEPPEAHA